MSIGIKYFTTGALFGICFPVNKEIMDKSAETVQEQIFIIHQMEPVSDGNQ